jgi:hypothetical protein
VGKGHSQKPNPNAAKLLATMTSVNGVLDINASIFSGPADFVAIYNSLGPKPYDPAGPIFRVDQEGHFLENVWPKVTMRAARPIDTRIVQAVNYADISDGAPYETGAIFGATITYVPDNAFYTDPAGNPITQPAYLVELA